MYTGHRQKHDHVELSLYDEAVCSSDHSFQRLAAVLATRSCAACAILPYPFLVRHNQSWFSSSPGVSVSPCSLAPTSRHNTARILRDTALILQLLEDAIRSV